MNEKYLELETAVKKLIIFESKYSAKSNPEVFKKLSLKILNIAKDIMLDTIAFGYEKSLPSPYCEKAAREINALLKNEAIKEMKYVLLKRKNIEDFKKLVVKYETKSSLIMSNYIQKYFDECKPKYFVA